VLHTLALRSLKNLCAVRDISEQMDTFLFSHQQSSEEEFPSVMSILVELMTKKSLKLEVIALVIAMKQLLGECEFVSDEMRRELFMNVLTGTKKVAAETVSLMEELEVDFWPEIIQLMNFYAGEDFHLDQFVETIKSMENIDCDWKTLLRVTTDNLQMPATSQRAAEILIILLKQDESEQKAFLNSYQSILLKCLEEERTFITLLDFFILIDKKKIFRYYKENPSKLHSMVELLLDAFMRSQQTLAQYNICDVLRNLFAQQPEYITREVRKVFELLYGKVKEIREDPTLAHTNKDFVEKLAILLENRKFNLIPPSQMIQIDQITKEFCDDLKAELYPLFVKLRVNVLKHLWTRLMLNKPIPNDPTQLTEDVKKLAQDILSVIDREGFDLEQNHQLLSAFADIMAAFQPSEVPHTVTKPVLILDKQVIKNLGDLVDCHAFAKDNKLSDPEVFFRREMIISVWNNFIKRYHRLPSATASAPIISNYRPNHPLKHYLEDLLKLIILKSMAFHQNIAFAILHIMNRGNFQQFRGFFQAIEQFMTENFPKQQRSLTLVMICSSIMSKVPMQLKSRKADPKVNRLEILECVMVIGKNFSPAIKKDLGRVDCDPSALSRKEKVTLQQFLGFLSS
jgi:hypothetical protein